MKIKRVKNKNMVNLDCVEVGHIFQYEDGTIFIKIRGIVDQKNGYLYNAVEIETGDLECFPNETYVNLIDAELVVKEQP
jgi:hypothetical protein